MKASPDVLERERNGWTQDVLALTASALTRNNNSVRRPHHRLRHHLPRANTRTVTTTTTNITLPKQHLQQHCTHPPSRHTRIAITSMIWQERAHYVHRGRKVVQPCRQRAGADVCVGKRVGRAARAWHRERFEGKIPVQVVPVFWDGSLSCSRWGLPLTTGVIEPGRGGELARFVCDLSKIGDAGGGTSIAKNASIPSRKQGCWCRLGVRAPKPHNYDPVASSGSQGYRVSRGICTKLQFVLLAIPATVKKLGRQERKCGAAFDASLLNK